MEKGKEIMLNYLATNRYSNYESRNLTYKDIKSIVDLENLLTVGKYLAVGSSI